MAYYWFAMLFMSTSVNWPMSSGVFTGRGFVLWVMDPIWLNVLIFFTQNQNIKNPVQNPVQRPMICLNVYVCNSIMCGRCSQLT